MKTATHQTTPDDMSSSLKPEPINLDNATTVILAIAGKFDNIFFPSGTYDIAGIAVRWIETRGNTHYFSPIDRPHPFQLPPTPFDECLQSQPPESEQSAVKTLNIGGYEFVPYDPDRHYWVTFPFGWNPDEGEYFSLANNTDILVRRHEGDTVLGVEDYAFFEVTDFETGALSGLNDEGDSTLEQVLDSLAQS